MTQHHTHLIYLISFIFGCFVDEYLGISDFAGINWYYNREEYTTAYSYEIEQFEFKINKRGLIESEAEYQRPITVEAEMRSSENTMTMTLFGDQKLMFGSEFTQQKCISLSSSMRLYFTKKSLYFRDSP